MVSSDGFRRCNIDDFIDTLNKVHSGIFSFTLSITSIQDLEAHGVPEDIIEDLIGLNASGIEEHVVVVAFFYLLSQQKRFKKEMSRSLRRIIIKAYKQLPEFRGEIAQKIEQIIVSNCDF